MANQKISARTVLTGSGFVSRPAVRAGSTTDYRTVDNLIATTDPTANDDAGDGFHIGSVWYNSTLDKLYVCSDATTTAAVWRLRGTIGAPVQPVYGISTVYLTMPLGGTSTAVALTANRLYMSPIVVPERRAFTVMAIQCTTGVGSAVARVGLYNATANRQPSTLIAEATTDGSTYPFDLSANGMKTATIAQTLDPGLYFAGLIGNSTASISMGTVAPNSMGTVMTGATSSISSRGGFFASTYGALSGIASGDMSGTTFTWDSPSIPVIGLR